MIITLSDYLIFSNILFGLGIVGIFVNRKNIIVNLMCIEIILLAVNTNFIVFSKYLHNISGQVFVIFILVIAAVKTAIGLVILMLLFKKNYNISIEKLNILKG